MNWRASRVAGALVAASFGGAACTQPESAGDESAQGEVESEASEGGDAQLVEAYCTCMLFQCHDHYHELWGEDEMVARAACLEVAEGLPVGVAGEMQGDNLECRFAMCQMSSGEGDPLVCPAALGATPCADP